jgi:thiol-disulfide isomerase/thioredoxin
VKTEPNFYFVALKDSLDKKNETISESEQSLLDSLIICTTNSSVDRIMKKSGNVFQDLYDKYADLIESISQVALLGAQENNLKKYFGLDRGLVSEIMYSQAMSSMIKSRQKPLNEKSKNNIKSTVKTPFIADYLVKMSDDMQKEIDKKLAANKNKTGYVINETPKTEGDKIFDAIMEKYRGKVVFVDFWATWCSPCRSGIENMKPLKEEMKDKDVVFVYITNPGSPTDTWNMMVPDIKGEHYRINQDEWNNMSSKFNITGIPHYVLVDKTGKVVLDKIFFASSTGEFKKLIEEQLK